MSTLRPTITSLLFVTASALLIAQAALEFEVVSIKRVTELRQTSGSRTLPDGSEVLANISVAGFVRQASPIKVREVINLPEWANTERFDVTVKPPAAATAEQRRAMWGAMFADRMKLVAHMEQRERTAYALVPARSDRRLGPQLKPSALDCTPRPQQPLDANAPFRLEDAKSRCGYAMSGTSFMSLATGGMSMDQLALVLDG